MKIGELAALLGTQDTDIARTLKDTFNTDLVMPVISSDDTVSEASNMLGMQESTLISMLRSLPGADQALDGQSKLSDTNLGLNNIIQAVAKAGIPGVRASKTAHGKIKLELQSDGTVKPYKGRRIPGAELLPVQDGVIKLFPEVQKSEDLKGEGLKGWFRNLRESRRVAALNRAAVRELMNSTVTLVDSKGRELITFASTDKLLTEVDASGNIFVKVIGDRKGLINSFVISQTKGLIIEDYMAPSGWQPQAKIGEDGLDISALKSQYEDNEGLQNVLSKAEVLGFRFTDLGQFNQLLSLLDESLNAPAGSGKTVLMFLTVLYTLNNP